MLRIAALRICLFIALTVPGAAQEWIADRLRGDVQQMVSGQWLDLVRGAVVLDGNQVRTGQNSRVSLVRGSEVLELGPATQIRLREGSGKRTSIVLAAGTLTADVERRNVQHFSVITQYLAAIVKGTRFRVTVANGAALVEVDRGTVQVQDKINDLVADVERGQEAQVSRAEPLKVSGPGAVAVYTFEGERVVNGTTDVPADVRGRPAQDNEATIPTQSNGGGSGHGNSANNNSSGNSSNGDSSGNGNGNSGNGNSGGNSSGNSGNSGGNGNGNSSNSDGGGNGNGNSGNGNSGGNGNGNSGNGNSGGNGNGNASNSDGGGNSSGNSGNSNSGGNGNGNSGSGNGGGNGNGNKRLTLQRPSSHDTL